MARGRSCDHDDVPPQSLGQLVAVSPQRGLQ
jgi:hypothetical protein